MEESDVDTTNEQVDAMLTQAEEVAANTQFARSENVQDLSDGGMVNGVRLSPMSGGKIQEKGRPAARRAWMWNGTESVLPLAWNPDGTIHDGARRYLLKRHCLCCGTGGFRGAQCPNCLKNACTRCNRSTKREKIIPCFYLRKEDVPYPSRFYGNINCFLESCVRRDDAGFLTQEAMRMHARFRHGREYQAHIEELNASKVDQVDVLQKRLDDLLASMGRVREPAPAPVQAKAPIAVVAVPKPTAKPRVSKNAWSPERRAAASKAYKARAAGSVA